MAGSARVGSALLNGNSNNRANSAQFQVKLPSGAELGKKVNGSILSEGFNSLFIITWFMCQLRVILGLINSECFRVLSILEP